MLLGIDHLVIAVEDPDAAADLLHDRLGLVPGGGGRHERLGTFNRLVWMGDTYLELIGVFDRALAAASWVGAPTLRSLDAGGGLATWAVATDAIAPEVERLRAAGSDLADPIPGERTRPDGRTVRWQLAVPPSLGPETPPFLIEHDTSAAEWTASERAERAAGPARLDRLELAVDHIDRTSRAFARTVGLRFRPSLAGGGTRDADIGGQRLRLRPNRATSRIATIAISSPDRERTELEALGCRWVVGR